jgi:hypothetical protein
VTDPTWLAPTAHGAQVRADARARVAHLPDPVPAVLREPCHEGCGMCQVAMRRDTSPLAEAAS